MATEESDADTVSDPYVVFELFEFAEDEIRDKS